MDKQKADELIFSYVRKIFGFAMSKLSKIDEAEELAAEITVQVYSSLLKQDKIENPDGYIFRIARNVYAKHIDGKRLTASVDGIEYLPNNHDFTFDLVNSESYGILRREITYLSKIQRKIIVLKCTLCQGHCDFFLFRFLFYIYLLCRGIKVMPLIDCFHLLI